MLLLSTVDQQQMSELAVVVHVGVVDIACFMLGCSAAGGGKAGAMPAVDIAVVVSYVAVRTASTRC